MASPTGHGGRDHPDFGISGTVQGKSLILDMSELAARLGSGNYFDRRGVQIWSERFDYGLRGWTESVIGAASHIYPCADYAVSGSYALDMACEASIGASATIACRLPYPYISSVGLEFHVKHYTAGEYFYCTMILYGDPHTYNLTAYIDSTNKKLYFTTDTAGQSPLTLSDYMTGPTSPFHVIKMRADIENQRWIEIMVDTDEYDLRDAVLARTGAAANKQMYLYFGGLYIRGTASRDILDNIIITLDEPG